MWFSDSIQINPNSMSPKLSAIVSERETSPMVHLSLLVSSFVFSQFQSSLQQFPFASLLLRAGWKTFLPSPLTIAEVESVCLRMTEAKLERACHLVVLRDDRIPYCLSWSISFSPPRCAKQLSILRPKLCPKTVGSSHKAPRLLRTRTRRGLSLDGQIAKCLTMLGQDCTTDATHGQADSARKTLSICLRSERDSCSDEHGVEKQVDFSLTERLSRPFCKVITSITWNPPGLQRTVSTTVGLTLQGFNASAHHLWTLTIAWSDCIEDETNSRCPLRCYESSFSCGLQVPQETAYISTVSSAAARPSTDVDSTNMKHFHLKRVVQAVQDSGLQDIQGICKRVGREKRISLQERFSRPRLVPQVFTSIAKLLTLISNSSQAVDSTTILYLKSPVNISRIYVFLWRKSLNTFCSEWMKSERILNISVIWKRGWSNDVVGLIKMCWGQPMTKTFYLMWLAAERHRWSRRRLSFNWLWSE
jgi:hypothetical protein